MTIKSRHRSFSGSLESRDLQRHVLRTYFTMRVGIAIIGLALPLLLFFGGQAVHICPQASMSAYYHAVGSGGASMRNWFVGLLFAIAISLGLYRGFSRAEDWLLNAAAVLGICIAVFPSSWHPSAMQGCGVNGSAPYSGAAILGLPVHETCAISFFLCISLVCWFCADDTLSLVPSLPRRRRLRRAYRLIAVLMPAAMLAAWGLNALLVTGTAVFWVEGSGVFAFGAYWLLKGFELNRTAADLQAASGMLRQRQGELEAVAPRP